MSIGFTLGWTSFHILPMPRPIIRVRLGVMWLSFMLRSCFLARAFESILVIELSFTLPRIYFPTNHTLPLIILPLLFLSNFPLSSMSFSIKYPIYVVEVQNPLISVIPIHHPLCNLFTQHLILIFRFFRYLITLYLNLTIYLVTLILTALFAIVSFVLFLLSTRSILCYHLIQAGQSVFIHFFTSCCYLLTTKFFVYYGQVESQLQV